MFRCKHQKLMTSRDVRDLVKEIVMTAAQDAVDAVVAQLNKAKGEILTEISNLQAQVDAGQPVNLDALTAAAQSLDDINVDAPPAEPTA